MEMREVPGLEFGAAEVAAFAPLLAAIESFAQQHGLEVSRVRDRDPVGPAACCFLSWRGQSPKTGGRCWISVGARDPLNLGDEFRISAVGNDRGDWEYAAAEGLERLLGILEQARSIATHP
jgi:hypothetical protein